MNLKKLKIADGINYLAKRSSMKRLGILFFYDKFGKVDQYLEYLLENMNQFLDELLIVSNGDLEKIELTKLRKYGEVLTRENKGFDVWAYKAGIEHIGWDRLNEFDEFIMFNNTIMGPVDSFDDTFIKMDKMLEIDFWGLTKYFEFKKGDPFGTIKYGYVPDHIQSHFIAVRKNMFCSTEFKDYWENMKMVTNYEEAIGYHEAIFTKHFSDLGYKWMTSVEMEELRQFNNYPLLMSPKKMIKEFNCPIFKKRSFFHDINDSLRNTSGEQASLLYDYLKSETNYDVEMIWPAILRNNHQYDIVKNLNLEYTLSTKNSNIPKINNDYKNKKVAYFVHIYFEDLVEEMAEWAKALPKFFHVFVTVVNESTKRKVEKYFSKLEFDKLEVRIIENRGRDVAALLVAVKDVVMAYDIACFAHDKKTAQVKPLSVGASFGYKCFENILSNQNYVYNILDTFESNPHLGIMSPPEPNHADFFPTLGQEWGPNFEVTKKLAKKLKIDVPLDVSKPPVAPLGTMFWFRPVAMKKLFDKDWNFEDFPEEPNKEDGTLLHAVERIYPFVVQNEGYYPSYVMSDKFTAVEFMNLHHYVRSMNQAIHSHNRYFDERVVAISSGEKLTFKLFLKKVLWKIVGKKNYYRISSLRTKGRIKNV